MCKFAKYRFLDTSRFERVIVLSDVHGDADGFKAVLDKSCFSEKDALIIVGDILEKGGSGLPLLHHVMELAKTGRVFMVLGNNDALFIDWRDGITSDEAMLNYTRIVTNCTLFEMGRELSLPWNTLEELKTLKKAIFYHYADEIAFLDSLPHIIETEFAVLVHAGLDDRPLFEQKPETCLSKPHFGTDKHRFDKTVIVGHWPASNYCESIINVAPYYNDVSNIISIDGGNSLKSWGQINYLVFRSGAVAESGYYDSLPKIRVLEAQKESDNPTLLIHPKTLVEIINRGKTETLCFIPAINSEKTIVNEKIYEYRGNCYCWDYTDYKPELAAGDIVSLCQTDEYGTLIKKHGIVGYYTGRWEFT